MAILAVSTIRKRVVANGGFSAELRSHADPMVRRGWTDWPGQQVFVVEPQKETAGCVARTPGGVRGGGREAPLYSIAFTEWMRNMPPVMSFLFSPGTSLSSSANNQGQ
jgi:hypothetical protein